MSDRIGSDRFFFVYHVIKINIDTCIKYTYHIIRRKVGKFLVTAV